MDIQQSWVALAAFLPSPGLSANDQRRTERIDGRVPPKTDEWTDLGDNVWRIGPNTATELFFDDATPSQAKWAIQRLRPQAYGVMGEVTPLTGAEKRKDLPKSPVAAARTNLTY